MELCFHRTIKVLGRGSGRPNDLYEVRASNYAFVLFLWRLEMCSEQWFSPFCPRVFSYKRKVEKKGKDLFVFHLNSKQSLTPPSPIQMDRGLLECPERIRYLSIVRVHREPWQLPVILPKHLRFFWWTSLTRGNTEKVEERGIRAKLSLSLSITGLSKIIFPNYSGLLLRAPGVNWTIIRRYLRAKK